MPEDKFTKQTKVPGNPSIRPKKGAIDAVPQRSDVDIKSVKK